MKNFIAGLVVGLLLAAALAPAMAQSSYWSRVDINGQGLDSSLAQAEALRVVLEIARSEINILRAGLQQVTTELNNLGGHHTGITQQTLPPRTLAQFRTEFCSDPAVTCN